MVPAQNALLTINPSELLLIPQDPVQSHPPREARWVASSLSDIVLQFILQSQFPGF